MKKSILAVAFFSLACMGSAYANQPNGGFTGPSNTSAAQGNGGFTGPSAASSVVTVEQVKSMRDDTHVTMRGHIIQHLHDDNYTFQDDTGTITVDIDHNKWNGQTVSPQNLVEVYGEVDKDRNSVEVDVKSIRIIQ